MNMNEAAVMEGDYMDSDMMDSEDIMNMIGENIKLENVQKMLKDSMVDTEFYNKFDACR